jgi:hypothetical protein
LSEEKRYVLNIYHIISDMISDKSLLCTSNFYEVILPFDCSIVEVTSNDCNIEQKIATLISQSDIDKFVKITLQQTTYKLTQKTTKYQQKTKCCIC